VPILEEHLIGLDPSYGASVADGCPFLDLRSSIVWYEKWGFTGYAIGNKISVGIGYTHCYFTFDHVGNLISDAPTSELLCFGFSTIRTGTPTRPPPTPEQLLAEARERAKPYNLPPPGTIMLHPDAVARLGVRA
jgi:hypothetical protein